MIFRTSICVLVVIEALMEGVGSRGSLRIGVGIINSGKTFPCASSYCPGDTTESFDLFFQILREEMWVDL